MRRVVAILILLACPQPAILAQRSAPATAPAPAALVAAAIEAMGGEARLNALRSIRIDAVGHEWALEQSERPEGPWLATYTQRQEIRDLAGGRVRRQVQTRNWSRAQWATAPLWTVVAGGAVARTDGQRWMAGPPTEIADVAETLALSPERLLFTARSAPDLHAATGRTLQGVAQRAVAFTWDRRPVTLFMNEWTSLPTMMEIVREDTWGVWGDVTERRWYSFWSLDKGVYYPRQTSVEWNGYPFRDTTIMELGIDDPIDEAQFQIPADTRQAFATLAAAAAGRVGGLAAMRVDAGKAVTLGPSIVQLAGPWNVLLVRQPDGVVIIEAPISAGYTQDVLAAVEQHFRGVPIKAAVTTSDAWPHIGGVREYVARKIPIYALDLNLPILNRLVKAPRTGSPDALSQKPALPRWTAVDGPVTIGSGDLRVTLIPVHGEIGERMMIAALPGQKLVYTSDLIQPAQRGGGFFMPSMLGEAIRAVERAKVPAPEQAVGMHLAPTPWTTIVSAYEAARK